MDTSSFESAAVRQFEEKLGVISNLLDIIGEEPDVRKRWEQGIAERVMKMLEEMVAELNVKSDNLIESITRTVNKSRIMAKILRLENPPDLRQDVDKKRPLRIAYDTAQAEYERLKEQLDAFQDQIRSLELREYEICSQLDRTPKRLHVEKNILPTSNEIDEFQTYLNGLDAELYERRAEYNRSKKKIQYRVRVLRYAPNAQHERDILNDLDDGCFKLSDTNMQHVQRFEQDLQRRYELLRSDIDVGREKLQTLWEMLEVDLHERNGLLERCTANDFATLDILQQEIAKLDEQKRLNIERFVRRLRHELQQLWIKCLASDEQKASFTVYLEADFYTEDLLDVHEMEVEKVKCFYKRNKELYNLFGKRNELYDKLADLEGNAADPNRFKNRGGTLLKQQKEKKAAEISLLKVEKILLQLANTFEQTNGQPFLVYGRDIREIIEKRTQQVEPEQQLHLSTRKGKLGLTPTPGKTPLSVMMRSARTKIATTSSRNLITPHRNGGTPLSNAKTAPPKMLHVKSTISKKARLSIKKAKKMNEAVKRLSKTCRSKENKASPLKKISNDEYKDFLCGANFARSTIFCADKNHSAAGTASRSPLAMLLPKSPVTREFFQQ